MLEVPAPRLSLFGVAIDPKLGDRDPLEELIEAAHAVGIKVFAWFEFGFSCSYQKRDGGHLLIEKPAWAAIDREGQLVSRNGFQWMNAFDPDVQDFLIAMLKEAVERYDLDGVQGDDRLPALPNTGGYDPLTVSLYQADHGGASPPDDPTDAEWTQWRADRLSRFAERTYRELKAPDPQLCVSWSPSVYPWSKQNYRKIGRVGRKRVGATCSAHRSTVATSRATGASYARSPKSSFPRSCCRRSRRAC